MPLKESGKKRDFSPLKLEEKLVTLTRNLENDHEWRAEKFPRHFIMMLKENEKKQHLCPFKLEEELGTLLQGTAREVECTIYLFISAGAIEW